MPGQDCEIFLVGDPESIKIQGEYRTGYWAFYNDLAEEASTDDSKLIFANPANIPDADRATSTEMCKKYIDISRVMMSSKMMADNIKGNPAPLSRPDIDGRKPTAESKRENGFVTVSPNPADKGVDVQLMEGDYSIHLYDMSGKLLHSKVTFKSTFIPLEEINNGIYYLQVLDKMTGLVETKKVVVTH